MDSDSPRASEPVPPQVPAPMRAKDLTKQEQNSDSPALRKPEPKRPLFRYSARRYSYRRRCRRPRRSPQARRQPLVKRNKLSC